MEGGVMAKPRNLWELINYKPPTVIKKDVAKLHKLDQDDPEFKEILEALAEGYENLPDE